MLNTQEQPELAIVFLKQSVNVYETIRGDIRSLSRELQQSYTETVSGTYRQLANLLLSQGRILEAQRVLELLKVEELREFTRNAELVGTPGNIAINDVEQTILREHTTLISFGQKVYECEQTQCAQLNELSGQQSELATAYERRVSAMVNTIRDNRFKDEFSYDPRYLSESARKIVEAQPGTVLIYPFISEGKLWLLWTAPGGAVGSIAVNVTQDQLSNTIVRFRDLLDSPDSNLTELQATGKQLYQWIIQPACETALGGPGADGIEVAGISSYFLRANRASTVIASLWLVNDASTSLLMQRFYQNLSEGMTKAEALQKAQLSLLEEQGTASGNRRSEPATIVPTDSRTGQPRVAGDLRHPYYWSPFIIIGNGL